MHSQTRTEETQAITTKIKDVKNIKGGEGRGENSQNTEGFF